MKKKIALLLAAVMTFAVAVPMNLFAAQSESSLTHVVTSNKKGDSFVDQAMTTLPSNVLNAPINRADSTTTPTGVTSNATTGMINLNNDLGKKLIDKLGALTSGYQAADSTVTPALPDQQAFNGMYNLSFRPKTDSVNLVLDFGSSANPNSSVKSFRIKLTNAFWSFMTADNAFTGGAITNFDMKSAIAADEQGFVIPGTADPLSVNAVNSTSQAQAWANDILGTTGAITAGQAAVPATTAAGENKLLYWNNADAGRAVAGGTGTDNEYVIYIENDTTAVVFFIPSNSRQLVIPMVVTATSDKAIGVDVVDGDSGYVKAQTLNFSNAGSGTTATMDEATGRSYIDLATIKIVDKAPGSMLASATGNKVVLTAPEGYAFANSTSAIVVKINGQPTNYFVSASGIGSNKLTINLPDAGDGGTGGPGMFGFGDRVINTLTIDNVRIVPVDMYDADLRNVSVEIKIDDNTLRISKGAIATSPKFIDWYVGFSVSEVAELKAGRKAQATKTVVLEELAPNSWWTDRLTTFTLVDEDKNPIEGVIIAAATVAKENYSTTSIKDGVKFYPTWDASKELVRTSTMGKKDDDGNFLSTAAGGNSSINEDHIKFNQDLNGFTLIEAGQNSTAKVKVSVTFELSTDVMFDGPVYVLVESATFGAKNEYVEEAGFIKLADVKKQIDVDAAITKIEIGAQKVGVKDVTITEVATAGLIAGTNKNVTLTIGEFGQYSKLTGGLQFIPFGTSGGVASATVDGAKDKDFRIGTPTGAAGYVTVPVLGASKNDKKGEIFIQNIAVQIDRTVPNGFYDLMVDGEAVRNTIVGTAIGNRANSVDLVDRALDFFDYGFILKDYIHVATEQANVMNKKNVKIVSGSNVAEVDGVAVEMNFASYYEAGALYVPVRFVSEVLGGKVDWNNDDRIVSVSFPEKTLQFQVDSKYYNVAGEFFPRLNESGATTQMHMIEGGGVVLIPFRSLGVALDMDVEGFADGDAVVGIYNPIR